MTRPFPRSAVLQDRRLVSVGGVDVSTLAVDRTTDSLSSVTGQPSAADQAESDKPSSTSA